MTEKDTPNIPCDYCENNWHKQLFAGNTAGVVFITELLSSSFHTLRTHVYKGLSNVSHAEDSAVENRLFIDVFFHLIWRPFNICLPLLIYTVSCRVCIPSDAVACYCNTNTFSIPSKLLLNILNLCFMPF